MTVGLSCVIFGKASVRSFAQFLIVLFMVVLSFFFFFAIELYKFFIDIKY